MKAITISELSEILFGEIFPEEMVSRYQKQNDLDLKAEFVEYFRRKNLIPRFDREISRIMLLGITLNYKIHVLYDQEEIDFIRTFAAFNDHTLLVSRKK